MARQAFFSHWISLCIFPCLLSGCKPSSAPNDPSGFSPRELAFIHSPQAIHLCEEWVHKQGPAEGLSICLEQAKHGNVYAQAMLSTLYRSGELGEADLSQSFGWRLLAAQKGYVPAQYQLAKDYWEGKGTSADPQQAIYWLSLAAKSHYLPAKTLLSKYYLTLEDPASALSWLMRAASDGEREALYLLALDYLEGKRVESNPIVAEQLLLQAAKQEYALAMVKLAGLYQTGIGEIPASSSKADGWFQAAIETQDAEALFQIAMLELEGKWQGPYQGVSLLTMAANQQHVEAQLTLAKLYQHGLEGDADPLQATKWFLAAAQNNDAESCYELARRYFDGTPPLAADYKLGLEYLTRAAINGYYPAQFQLALLALENESILPNKFQVLSYLQPAAEAGVTEAQLNMAKLLAQFTHPQYDEVALWWLEKAASEQNSEAQYMLADFYYQGIGTAVDYGKAFALLTELAQQEHGQAQAHLAKMHYLGQGTLPDENEAKKWAIMAAEKGINEAQQLVKTLLQNSQLVFSVNEEDNDADLQAWANYAAERG